MEQRLSRQRARPELADLELAQLIEKLADNGSVLAGTAEQIARHIQNYVQAGTEELMLQWLDLDDLAGLRTFANEVLPRLQV